MPQLHFFVAVSVHSSVILSSVKHPLQADRCQPAAPSSPWVAGFTYQSDSPSLGA